jgi:hypothetical protein
VALQFNIEEVVQNEIQDRSPIEVGSTNLLRKLRAAFSDATVLAETGRESNVIHGLQDSRL